MKVYISFPISGYDIEERRRFSDRVAEAIRLRGHEPLNPLDVYAGTDPDYFDHICYDLRAMLDCDAVLMLHGWEESRGCRLEYHAAKIYGLAVFTTFDQLGEACDG